MVETLQQHDMVRLNRLSTQIIENPQTVSFEGEPLYADRAWSEFHEFCYGSVIPVLIKQVSVNNTTRLDLLYDECTVQQLTFSSDHFLGQITQALNLHLNGQTDHLSIHIENESYFLDRGEEWIRELKGRGATRQYNGTTELSLPHQRPISLTTRSGRPACVVLDAVYQTTKSEGGVEVAVLVHSTQFRGQQEDMQTVLFAVGQGIIPFSAFVNVFTRERKGELRVAAIRNINSNGQVTEIT